MTSIFLFYFRLFLSTVHNQASQASTRCGCVGLGCFPRYTTLTSDRSSRSNRLELTGSSLRESSCHRQSTPHSCVTRARLRPTTCVCSTPCCGTKPLSDSTSGVLSHTPTRTVHLAASCSCSCPECHPNLTYYSLLLPANVSSSSSTTTSSSFNAHSAPGYLGKRRSLSLVRPI